ENKIDNSFLPFFTAVHPLFLSTWFGRTMILPPVPTIHNYYTFLDHSQKYSFDRKSFLRKTIFSPKQSDPE
ncbi:hypothetical protein KQH31_31210, partial [Streptomyces sp. CHA15]|nr:hypothetical protein [Streptomyces sp. CHA15]